MTEPKDPRTIAVTNGIASDEAFGAVTPPVYLTSTFAFSGFEKHRGYEYSRTANPGRDLLADTLARLEGGAGAVVTSSGMAAVDLVLSLADRDGLVVAPHDCYGGTYRLLSARRDRGHFDLLFVDQSNAAALTSALARKPSLVLIETPSNPLMRVVDIRASRGRRGRSAQRLPSTTPFSRRRCSGRSSLVRTSSSTPRRNTSMAIPMSWAAPSSARLARTWNRSAHGPISPA